MIKRILTFWVFIIFISVLFSGCATTFIFPNTTSTTVVLNNIRGKKVFVYNAPNVNLDEFKKTYVKVYTDNATFANQFTNQFLDSIRPLGGQFIHFKKSSNPSYWVNKSSLTLADRKQILESDTIGPDYIIWITETGIGNKWQGYGGGAPMMAGGGGMMYGGGGGRMEYCLVSFTVNITEAETGTNISSFKTVGQSQVGLFDYEATFRDAISNSIQHAVEYIRSGKVKFEEM